MPLVVLTVILTLSLPLVPLLGHAQRRRRR